MPLRDTLARVEEDLAAGRVPLARQRLRGLVSSFPRDLPLRRRLAEVYRLYGESAEAGRWMYLEADRDPAETAAFEARYRTAPKRLAALGWDGPESLAPTDLARERLAALRAECPEEGSDTETAGSSGKDFLPTAGCLLVALVLVAIWVNGFVALFD